MNYLYAKQSDKVVFFFYKLQKRLTMCIVTLNLVYVGGRKLKEVKLLFGEVKKYRSRLHSLLIQPISIFSLSPPLLPFLLPSVI